MRHVIVVCCELGCRRTACVNSIGLRDLESAAIELRGTCQIVDRLESIFLVKNSSIEDQISSSCDGRWHVELDKPISVRSRGHRQRSRKCVELRIHGDAAQGLELLHVVVIGCIVEKRRIELLSSGKIILLEPIESKIGARSCSVFAKQPGARFAGREERSVRIGVPLLR